MGASWDKTDRFRLSRAGPKFDNWGVSVELLMELQEAVDAMPEGVSFGESCRATGVGAY